MDELRHPAHAIARDFDDALAFASDKRSLLEDLRRDPVRFASVLTDALTPFDSACARLHLEFDDSWPERGRSAAVGSWLRVSHALEPLLADRENGPRLLKDQTVLIQPDGDIFLQQEPGQAGGDHAKSCCFTMLKLKNISGVRLRVKFRHDNGSERSHVFEKDETLPVTYRQSRDYESDGPVIPGGLGRCIPIQASEQTARGQWIEVLNVRFCCDQNPAPRRGDRIGQVRSLGGTPEHFARYVAFEIVDLKVESPCPNLAPAAPTGSVHGVADSQSSSYDGLETAPGKYQYGAGAWLRFIPRAGGCRNFCFVQGVIRRVFIQPPGGEERAAPMLGTPGDSYKLDVRPSDRTPCYPFTSRTAEGGLVLRDFPSVSNPWDPVLIDGKPAGRLAPGTRLRIQWTFRTWVVCLDGPVHVLGRFDWSHQVVIKIGRRRTDTEAGISPPAPVWSDDPDVDGYKDVAGQAAESGGFLPD